MKTWGWGLLSLAGCALALPLWAETLTPEGFPADWTTDDLRPGGPTNPSATTPDNPIPEGATPGVTPYAIPLPATLASPTQKHKKMVAIPVSQMKTVTLPQAMGVHSGTQIALPGLPDKPSLPATSPSTVVSGTVSATQVSTVAPTPAPPARPLWLPANGAWRTWLAGATGRGIASPAVRESLSILLQTNAPPPTGESPAAWLAFRANTLEKMGQYEAAWGLWHTLGAPSNTVPLPQEILYNWSQSRLLAGDTAVTCLLARDMAANAAPVPEAPWPVMVTLCQLVQPQAEGNVSAAGLSLQLIEPTLKMKNPALLKVLYAVQTDKPVGTQSGGPLGGAVLAAYPALIGSGTLAKMPDTALRRIMGTTALPLSLRAAAATALAAQTGTLADGTTSWALASPTALTGPVPDVMALAGATTLSASTVVPAALRLGQTAVATQRIGGWPMPPSATPSDKQAKQNLLYTQATLLVAAQTNKLSPAVWQRWQAAMPLETTLGTQTALRMVLGLDALGVPVPDTIWAALQNKGTAANTGADPLWQRQLETATTTAPETPRPLLLVAEGLAGRPPSEVTPGTLAAAIKALHTSGHTPLAWRLLAEATLPALPLRPMPKALPMPSSFVSSSVPAPVTLPSSTTPTTRNTLPEPTDMLPPPRVTPPRKPSVTKPVPPKL